MFNQLDANKDGDLTCAEFCLFVEGALMNRNTKFEELDDALKKEVEEEVRN